MAGLPTVPMCDAAPEPVLTSRIAAQPLTQALTAFAQQTSLQLVYESSLAAGLQSRGAPAGLAAPAALARILEGTGLRFEFLNVRTVRLLPGAKSLAAARAQSVPTRRARSKAGPEAERLAQVVVTATKREEALTTVPMSIYVLTAQEMYAANVHGIDGIAALTPGLNYTFSSEYGPGTYTDLSIRGIIPNSKSDLVGVYIDDVPLELVHTPFSYTFPLTFDLERVEVLRGPQGTLFGAGTAAGAIRFITTEPSLTQTEALYRVEIAGTEGGGMSYEAGAVGGGPLVDGLLGVRASAWFRRDGGYVDRVDPFTGATVDPNSNRRSSGAFRLAFALAPSDVVRITPAIYYQSIDVNDSPSFYTYLSDPGAGVFANGKLLRQPALDSFALASIKVAADFGAATLTSISAYFDRTGTETIDQTNAAGIAYYGGFGNPLGPEYPTSYDQAVATQLGIHQIALTQELRLASDDPDGRLRWLAGVFYSHARDTATHLTYAASAPQAIGVLDDGYFVNTEKAVFGEASLAIATHWRASLGTRLTWTHEDDIQLEGGFANSDTTPFAQVINGNEPAFTPRFSLSYQADADNLAYVSIAKGNEVGGVHTAGPPAECNGIPVPNEITPASVWSYELGAKDLLFDSRLRLATSLFEVKWNGIHLNVVDACGNAYVANAGTAASSGIDFSMNAALGHGVRASLDLEYADARYTKTVISADGSAVVTAGTQIGGLPSPPPPWSGTAIVEYDMTWSRRFMPYARAIDTVRSRNPGPYSEEGDPRSNEYDPSLYADPATNVLTLQLGVVRFALDVKVSVSNVLNSRPVLQRDHDAVGATLYYALTLRPRTVALTATQQF